MNRRVHLALALLAGLALTCAGAWLAGAIWPDDNHIAIGLAILWGVIVGMSVAAYWEEVIDRPTHTLRKD